MTFASPLITPTLTLNISEARDKLSELMERAHYRFEQIRIVRKDKPLARIVSDEYMEAIEQLISTHPGLADTIALMLNAEALTAIEESIKEAARGERLPLRELGDGV
jgi:prevent-host-death family protein